MQKMHIQTDKQDIIWFEFISKAQHPFGFQNNRIRNENLCRGKYFFGLEKLIFIISGEQPDNDIRVNSDHGKIPLLPGEQLYSSLRLFLPGRCTGDRTRLLEYRLSGKDLPV